MHNLKELADELELVSKTTSSINTFSFLRVQSLDKLQWYVLASHVNNLILDAAINELERIEGDDYDGKIRNRISELNKMRYTNE